MSFFDLIFIPLVFFTGHLIVERVVEKYKIESHRTILLRLFYYHVFFSLVFTLYIKNFGGDALGYWRGPIRFVSWENLHEPGTLFVYFITHLFSQIIGLSFYTGNLIFSLFGFGGLVCIYLTILKHVKVNPTVFGVKLFPLVLFLPNMHFWSSGVGKDSVIFFALTLFIFSMTNPLKNLPGLVISFYLAFYIRPHIALLMLVGFGFGLLVSTKNLPFIWRTLFLALSVAVFFLISPAVFDFIGLEEDSIESVDDISSKRSINLNRASVGSAINISDYSVPMKIITFLFRPFFFDAGNVFGLVVSVENLFYVVMTISILRFRNLLELWTMPAHLKASFFVLASTAFFMSGSLSNLGIIIRQKNMVMFMLILLVLYLLGKTQESTISNATPRTFNPNAKTKTT